MQTVTNPQSPFKIIKGGLMVLGVYTCYLFLNIFNQHLHKHPYQRYDKTGFDSFNQEASLICLTSFTCTAIGFLYHLISRPVIRITIPAKMMLKQSSIMFTTSFCVNKALNYVSFVTLSMVKSCSLLSVVIIGVFFTSVKNKQNKMSPTKIIVAGLIVIGTLVFQVGGNKTVQQSCPVNQITGFILLFISLICDGLIPDIQARTKQLYHPSSMELYQQGHRYIFIIALCVSLISGGLIQTFYFWATHSKVLIDCLGYIICGSIGHIFISNLVKNFNQFLVPLVLSIRKMLSIVASILWFEHQINELQLIGLVLVFSGALFEVIYKPKSKPIDGKQKVKVK